MLPMEQSNPHIELITKAGAVFTSKEEALREACRLLNEAGCVDKDYADSMLRREYISSTYLDMGLAIPHGTQNDMLRVKREGIAVLQVPGGVSWGKDQNAELIVAIAASSDAHLSILRHLVSLLHDKALLTKLKTTANAEEIKAVLLKPQ
ncbi:MAG: PTS sugar transporter subunit IIA [Treponema sp.]|jgi:phosphocarrier protein FPr|nr:PTS sugar transporter subunit IIA [Treponema sp.]